MPSDVSTAPASKRSQRLLKPRQRRSTPPPAVIIANAEEAAAETKRRVGRPSAYNPRLCNAAMALGMQGKSLAGIAAAFHVDKSTLLKWAGDYPEFSNALARAKTYEQDHWEEKGYKALPDKHFQAQVWKHSMSARFKDDYAEQRQGVDITLNLAHLVESSLGELARPVEAKVIEQASSLPAAEDPAKRGK